MRSQNLSTKLIIQTAKHRETDLMIAFSNDLPGLMSSARSLDDLLDNTIVGIEELSHVYVQTVLCLNEGINHPKNLTFGHLDMFEILPSHYEVDVINITTH
jgi:hypothetical protein